MITAVMQETIFVEHCGSMLYKKKDVKEEEENMVKTLVVSHGIDVELQTFLKYPLPRFVTRALHKLSRSPKLMFCNKAQNHSP